MSKVNSAAQTGILMPGPGATRASSLQANLAPLTIEQQELINRAKKYAMELSIKSVLLKQIQNQIAPSIPITNQTTTANTPNVTNSNSNNQQKSLQRHQALVLMCRVYVGSISFELKEETIKAAFNPFGAIKSINMSWDPITLKHKGFAFVEYELPEAAQLALEHMNGIQLGGRQIKVGRPSNMPQAAPIIQQIQDECKANNRIYVSNVHSDLFEQELSEIFDPFGKIKFCKLAMNPISPENNQPSHRGYGFIEFDSEAAALEALTMDKFDLGGQVLHVCRATTPAENLSPQGTLETEIVSQTALTNPQSSNLSSTSNMEDDIQLQLEQANKEQQEELYDLARTETSSGDLESTKCQNGTSSVKQGDKGKLSNVLVLRNMVSIEDELDDSLQLDVYEECSKYGPVTQVLIFVDKVEQSNTAQNSDNLDKTDQVKIFVKYKDQSGGSLKAREALNGRFFAGRKVSAEHYDQDLFRISDYSH